MYLNDAQLDSGALARRLLAPVNNLVPVNLLTRQQASLEDAGTTGVYVAGSCTLARSTAQAAVGVASISVTASVVATMGINVGSASVLSTASPVVGGRIYTMVASVRSDSVGRAWTPKIYWRDSAGTAISTGTGTAVTSTTTGWVEVRFTAVAPSNAAYAVIELSTTSGGAEIHYIDKVGLWEGAGGSWVNGGERLDPSTLGWYWDESVGRRLFHWDTINSRWQMTYGDTGWRDVSADIDPAVASGSFRVRRVNNQTTIRASLTWAVSTTTTFKNPLTLPTGFRADYSDIIRFQSYYSSGRGTPAGYLGGNHLIQNNGAIYTYGITSGQTAEMQYTFPSDVAWPTTLPGTASGSIPFN